MTLDRLSPDATAQIVTVHARGDSGGFRRRLLELGLVPGTRVLRIGSAPLGDPLTYRVRGAVIGLRRSEARQVEVQLP